MNEEELRREWKEFNGDQVGDEGIADWWLAKLTAQQAETEKAFGGCKKCYGKGYATTMEFSESYEDFGGEETERAKLPLMRFCSCGRGKQLNEIMK